MKVAKYGPKCPRKCNCECLYWLLLYPLTVFYKIKPINYFVFSYVGTVVHIPIFLLEVILFFFMNYSTVFLCFLEIFQYSQEKIRIFSRRYSCFLQEIFLYSLGILLFSLGHIPVFYRNIPVFSRKYSCILQEIFLFSTGYIPVFSWK